MFLLLLPIATCSSMYCLIYCLWDIFNHGSICVILMCNFLLTSKKRFLFCRFSCAAILQLKFSSSFAKLRFNDSNH
jgi:hypothetical protein